MGDGMYRRRKKISKRKLMLLSFIFIFVSLSLSFVMVDEKRLYTVPEKIFKDIGVVTLKIVRAPFSLVSNKITEFNEMKNMHKDYKQYKEKAGKYDLLQSKLLNLEKENEELKNSLSLESTFTDYTKTSATVIGRDLSYWFDFITIDKGSFSGIKPGMPVIINKGLIGRVEKTSYLSSVIKLLNTKETSFDVSVQIKTEKGYSYGILTEYDYEKKLFVIEGISEDAIFKTGSIVSTTGMGSLFPSGLLIGKVDHIDTDNFDLARIVYVKSDVDFDNLNIVTVLMREDLKWP